jgi:AraC-like DNA-binding protein
MNLLLSRHGEGLWPTQSGLICVRGCQARAVGTARRGCDEMSDNGKLTWEDWHGKEETRPINYTLDTRDHQGEPGWALLAIAANTHLSVSDLKRLLDEGSVERSRTWIQRRRWLFQQPDAVNSPGHPNKDGNDTRAREIMADNRKLSVRQLTKLLSESRIVRSREWVRRHRCDK